MELISQCAIRVAKLVWQPGHGGFAYTVVCKATFELMPELSPLAAAQEAVVEADVYTGSQQASLAQASELVPFKKRPEVILTGHAHAPDGRPVTSLVARLVVGEIDKAVQVDGDRQFDADGWIGDPEPFVRMPLVWERAAGGPGTLNPAGIALNADARVDALGQVAAPNLVPPGLFLTSRKKVVPPVGLGPISPRWALRAAHLHRHAARWDPDRWNQVPLPADVDVAYFNAAPPDQQRAEPFGEERIYLENLHPRFARLSTRLAPVSPAATVDQGSGPEPLRMRCDTLIVDADRGLAMLVWRAHVLLDHPDRPGRVLVTGPGEPEPAPQEWGPDVPLVGTTTLAWSVPGPAPEALPFNRAMAVIPTQLGLPPGPALPFGGKAAPVDVTEEAEPPPTAPRPGVRMTIGLSHLGPSAPVLPFGGKAAPAEGAPAPPEPEDDASATMPIADVSRTIGLSWLGPPSPAMPFAEKAAPAPPEEEEEDDASATMPVAGVSMTIGLSHPGPSSPALPFARATTMDVSQIKAPSVDLPFSGTAAQSLVPPSSSAPRENAPRPSVPGDDETTMAGMVRAPTLPFIGSRRESEAKPDTSAPAPVFVLESASSPQEAPETAADVARMRAIQQAIWKGDRPTRQVLAEHGLTEIEWRAMKRAAARRATA